MTALARHNVEGHHPAALKRIITRINIVTNLV
jgi:hypothetical protein